MRRQMRVLALMAIVAASQGCGGDDDPVTPTPNPGTQALTITITSQNGAQSFSPNPADVGGRTVVFHNADSVVHRVVLNDGSIDTGNIAPNATSAPVAMPGLGTNYHCSLHPDMVGAVNAVDGPPPTCMGIYC
jgi:plastocyanin